jgi:two-component sensor histidine kinase
VRDEGVGLPAEFDPRKAKGLGMRIINSFGEQLNAKVVARARNPGTEFVLSIPLRISSEAGLAPAGVKPISIRS